MIADVRIHALSTGTVQVKRCFLFPKAGLRRQLALFMPDEWSDPLPIHVWAIEHDDRLIVVDAGETAGVNNVPFARFGITPDQELPSALGAAGARFFQKVLRQPIPAGIDFQRLTLDDGPFGAFERSKRLTDDGRVVAIATPGHTPAHISVIAVDDDGNHVLLAGDATDTLEQLQARRADAIGPKPAVSIATLDRILAHAREHPTVYLPSHDSESAARLRERVTL
jgi:hypothetical protein